MRIAITTMVYNEYVNLPIWLRHHAGHCPGAALFVIDHGSDDGSTANIAEANLVPLPRTPFDDGIRAEFIADFQRGLLRYYDIVIYTDCDEMLVADPRRYPSLTAFLEQVKCAVTAPIGLNVQHIPDVDGSLDLTKPILSQRPHVQFNAAFCKPVVVMTPVVWVPGFHWCDRVPTYSPDLFLFHLHKMDIDTAMARLKITSAMAWSERAAAHRWSDHQRETDIFARRRKFEVNARRFHAGGVEPFEFSADIERLMMSLQEHGGFWCGEFRTGRFSAVPAAFRHLI